MSTQFRQDLWIDTNAAEYKTKRLPRPVFFFFLPLKALPTALLTLPAPQLPRQCLREVVVTLPQRAVTILSSHSSRRSRQADSKRQWGPCPPRPLLGRLEPMRKAIRPSQKFYAADNQMRGQNERNVHYYIPDRRVFDREVLRDHKICVMPWTRDVPPRLRPRFPLAASRLGVGCVICTDYGDG